MLLALKEIAFWALLMRCGVIHNAGNGIFLYKNVAIFQVMLYNKSL